MTRVNDAFAKLVSVVASAALVVGLMPLPTAAFADDGSSDADSRNTATPLTVGTIATEETPLTIGAQSTEDVVQVNTWEGLQDAIDGASEGEVIALGGDVVDAENKGSIKINKKVTIDLNGHKLDRHLAPNKCEGDGHVIHILNGGELTIKDNTDHGDGGQGAITGGFAMFSGGGVAIEKGGTLNIESGTIRGNQSLQEGGGVWVEGTLNMTGGAISGNSASWHLTMGAPSGGVDYGEGGGIIVKSGGKINLSNAIVANNDAGKDGGGIFLGKAESAAIGNCKITGNTSLGRGGGLYMDAEGKELQITATKIEENFASEGGGGIYLFQGAILMSGGTLSKNATAGYGGGADITSKTTFIANGTAIDGNAATIKGGGGVANFGTTELEGCVITDNSAVGSGGGVLGDTDGGGTGDLTLKGCTITGNRAVEDGGGVYNGKNLRVIGGAVSKNSTENMGGGIHIGQNAETTYVEGDLVVRGNTAGVFGNDLMVRSGHKLSTGKLTDRASIGVYLEEGTGILTKDYGKNNGSADPKSLFSASWGLDLELKDGEVEIKSDWSSIKSEIENAADGAVVPLSKDYAAGSSDDRIIIPEGKSVTVDLNGYTLNRNLSKKKEHGQVFEVHGTLVLKDGSATQRGAVTGGWADRGGGITVGEKGKLVLEGGTITRNRASGDGGGVFVKGSFDVRGGAIEGNEAEASGGGVYLEEKGVLSLEGGKIAENAAADNGGGVAVAREDTIVYAKGSPVVRNNSARGAGNDVFLPIDLRVTGAFDDGAKVGIALECGTGMFTFDYSKYNAGKDPAQFFVSTEGYVAGMDDGEVWLKKDTFGETDYEKPFIDWNDQIKTDSDALCSQNWMSGISGERYLNEINMPGAHDAGMHKIEYYSDDDWTSPIPFFSYGTGATYATTQTSYIDRILAMGARQLDIRLNDCYKKEYWYGYDWADDDENLWLCHGQSSFGGTYLAADKLGYALSLDTVLDWTKEFLEEHPTETVILNLRPETFRDGHEDPIMKRTRKILERKVLDINPSTGEPFLYKEPGSDDYFAAYTHIPQLKDCRGKIVLLPSRGKYVEQVGGYLVDKFVEHYEAPTDYKLTSSEKIREVPSAYAALRGGTVALPTAAGGQVQNYLWYWELNCTGEDQGVVEQYVLSGPNPVENAKVVNPALVGAQNVFGSYLGKYIGWVRMDGFESKYAEPIWRTNFFDELEYCTITVKSNLDDPNYPDQTYQLLKGTQITVPGNVYKQLPQGKDLDNWTAKATSQASETVYNPGATLSVTEDITFTAQWVKPSYSVKFDANVPAGASTTCTGSMEDQSLAYDEKKALTANGYSLPGYDFAGWNTKADGTGTPYADEEEVEGLSENGGTVTLYAHWSAKPYTIVFESDETGGDPHFQTAYFDQPGKLDAYSDEAFGWSAGGRTLHGWAGAGFGSFYGDGASFVNLCGEPRSDGSLADRELVAQWIGGGDIVVTITKDGVPQEGLKDELSLVNGSGTEFSVLMSYKNGKYIFDPSQASWLGTGPAQLPPGEYDLSFESSGYPKATAHITYGNDSAASAVFAYHTVTYKVENGTWADGATTAKTEVVHSGAFPTNVPTDMIAEGGFTGGMWDVEPSGTRISTATTFTYTFDAEQKVHGVVEWNDNDNESGERPEHVTVRLMANDAESSAMEVAEGANGLWAFSFDKLPPRDPQGNEIAYSVTADEVPGYSVEVVHADGNAYRITYTRPTPVKPTLTITAKDQNYAYNGQIQGEGDTAYEDPAEIAEKVTVEGLLEGDELTSVVLDGQGQKVGDYPIEVTGFSINNNPGARDKYDVVLVPGTLTIKPAEYTVQFVNYDGTVLQSSTVAYGQTPEYTGATPKRAGNVRYTYAFKGWTPAIGKVTGDTTYTATYASSERTYNATLAKMTAKGKRSLTLSWNKVNGADGYDVLFSRCNHGGKSIKPKVAATVKAGDALSWTKRGLKPKTAYKARVKAYVIAGGRKVYVKSSPLAHAYTSGGTTTRTNAKDVSTNKTTISLAKGKAFKLKARVTKLDERKKLMPRHHAAKLRYLSTDASVASVNGKGKIKGIAKGACSIYVYAHNGVYKKVKVKVT